MNQPRQLATLSLRVYQGVVSPLLHAVTGPGGGCRFSPTCSEYAIEAIRIHGFLAGGWLTVRRLIKCHPWGGCGADPVPANLPRLRNAEGTSPCAGHPTH
jgi:uncharacterized protein